MGEWVLEFASDCYEDLGEYCRNKSAYVHLPVLLWMIFLLYKASIRDYFWWNPFSYLDIGIHELGHFVTHPFGLNVSVPSGTLAQWSFPIFVAITFFRTREYFGIPLCLSWLGMSMVHSSWYCGTAQESGLVIGNIGSMELIHDWNYMLSKLEILRFDEEISQYIWIAAMIFSTMGVASGIWMILKMNWKFESSDLR